MYLEIYALNVWVCTNMLSLCAYIYTRVNRKAVSVYTKQI